MLLGVLGPLLGIDSESVRQFGGVMLVAFSAVMLVPRLDARFSAWMSPIAASANAASTGLDEKSLFGALLLGALLGLVWSPCSGPLLGTALTLVASEGGAVRGAAILGIFGIGAAVPLVAVAYASRGGLTRFRGRRTGADRDHQESIRHSHRIDRTSHSERRRQNAGSLGAGSSSGKLDPADDAVLSRPCQCPA